MGGALPSLLRGLTDSSAKTKTGSEGQDFLRKLTGSVGPLSGAALFRQQPGTDRNIPISSLFGRKIGG